MLISCPECGTSFAVPAKALGEDGRKVKCSKCTHVWHQSPIEVSKEQLDSILEDKKLKYNDSWESENKNLPAKVSRKAIYSSCGLLAFLVLMSATFFYFNNNIPDYNGLRFDNYGFSTEIIDNKYDVYISGDLINVTSQKIKIPEVQVRILSEGGRVMKEAYVKPEQDFIAPFSRITFSPDITQISGNASKVQLSFANWAERIFE